MARKPETKFKDRIREKLKTIPDCWFTKVQQVGINGTPDFLMSLSGLFVAIELKVDSEVSELQKYNLERIARSGGLSIVMTPENEDQIFLVLESLQAECKKYIKPKEIIE